MNNIVILCFAAVLIFPVFVLTDAAAISFSFSWGSKGASESQFNGPFGIAVDSSDNVYVTDTGNNRIQMFASDGAFIRSWGSLGSADGQFNSPCGIEVDSSDSVYGTDFYNDRIQMSDLRF